MTLQADPKRSPKTAILPSLFVDEAGKTLADFNRR